MYIPLLSVSNCKEVSSFITKTSFLALFLYSFAHTTIKNIMAYAWLRKCRCVWQSAIAHVRGYSSVCVRVNMYLYIYRERCKCEIMMPLVRPSMNYFSKGLSHRPANLNAYVHPVFSGKIKTWHCTENIAPPGLAQNECALMKQCHYV